MNNDNNQDRKDQFAQQDDTSRDREPTGSEQPTSIRNDSGGEGNDLADQDDTKQEDRPSMTGRSGEPTK